MSGSVMRSRGLQGKPQGNAIRSPPSQPPRSKHASRQHFRHQCRASADSDARVPMPPGDESVRYTDSATDLAFIGMCRKAYGNLAGWQSPRSFDDGEESFRGMVEVSRALMRGKSAQEQRDAVIKGFPEVPAWFRQVFPYSKWGAELNARITPAFFEWLVGEMETVEVTLPDGTVQRSGVEIKRCRYLAESGCVGMCVNLCKAPTQTFFTEQLGMPLTMEPDFETLGCKMTFGKVPPTVDEDEGLRDMPCYADCPASRADVVPCHKLSESRE
ncbi:unnamed protein product [Pedinophyceae sp. YPF-701]|nr:unnamed protein product [Pedinophyceae sp. YPF-701]